jgi:hypothetical protein
VPDSSLPASLPGLTARMSGQGPETARSRPSMLVGPREPAPEEVPHFRGARHLVTGRSPPEEVPRKRCQTPRYRTPRYRPLPRARRRFPGCPARPSWRCQTPRWSRPKCCQTPRFPCLTRCRPALTKVPNTSDPASEVPDTSLPDTSLPDQGAKHLVTARTPLQRCQTPRYRTSLPKPRFRAPPRFPVLPPRQWHAG